MLGLLPDLLGTARRLTGSSADAEDLVAEAVARAWIKLGALRQRDRFRGWTFRILTNLFLERRRAEMAHPTEPSLDDVSEPFSLFERFHQPVLLWWGDPERQFLDRLFRALLRIPIGTVRSRLARGRSLLQKALWEHALDAGLGGTPSGTRTNLP